MNCKAIFSDLDGTLFDTSSKLSSENSEAITKIAEKGILFVPTTGRTLIELPESIMNHKSIRYYIYSNGAGIYDKLEKKSYETLIAKDTIKKILDVLSSYKVLLLCHKEHYIYMDGKAFKDMERYKVYGAYKKLFKLLPEELLIDNFNSFLLGADNLEMICAFFGKNEKNEARCIKELSEIERVHITSSADGNIEIINSLANKGNAIRRFCEIIGAGTENIISVGDSKNDIEMLSAAGLSLAVENAKPEAKLSATRVICSNDEHIAKYILDNIIDV